jgi:photosystem II stability/assembly factor-like uncharacterized protein
MKMINKLKVVGLVSAMVVCGVFCSTVATYAQANGPIKPPMPKLSAVAGDGMVTLYWDDAAEAHADPFFSTLNPVRNQRNFEGYKIYKSTDPQFLDALRITDNKGNLIAYQPIAQFDLANSVTGYHPASLDGLRFWLGTDSGIRRTFVDDDVLNGRTYYYAVVSYTRGDAFANFTLPPPIGPTPVTEKDYYRHRPLESDIDIQVTLDANGIPIEVITGVNTVAVSPRAPSLGYIEPQVPNVNRVSGAAGGVISIDIIDPGQLKAFNEYEITFEDILISDGNPNTPDVTETKNFSLRNLTSGELIFDRKENFLGVESVVIEGFQLLIDNSEDTSFVSTELSQWVPASAGARHPFNFRVFSTNAKLNDYKIEFFDEVVAESAAETIFLGQQPIVFDSHRVNFKITNTTLNEEVEFGMFLNPNIPRDLRGVTYSDASTIYMVGGGGRLLKSIDAGQTYEELPTGFTTRLNDVVFPEDNNVGYIVGELVENRGIILKTTDGGVNWERQESPVIGANLNAVYFINNDIGWAVGQARTIIKTTDGGATWVQQGPVGVNRFYTAVYFADENNGWIVGQNGYFLSTSDGGTTWQIRTDTGNFGVQNWNANDFTFINDSTAYAVGTVGNIFKTVNRGVTWQRIRNDSQQIPGNSIGSIGTLNAVRFSDENNGIAVGNAGVIIRTTDAGATWERVESGTSLNIFALATSGDSFITGGETTRILLSDTDGASWVRSERPVQFRGFVQTSGVSPLPYSDVIYIIEPFANNNRAVTWRLSMDPDTRGATLNPEPGDVLEVYTVKPFTSADVYRFSIGEVNLPSENTQLDESALANIRVVPNPYVVSHIGETPTSGSQLHFTNLPARCTIRIFNVSGQLVQTLNIDNNLDNNRYIWDMKNRFGHQIPYGIYIYYVEAPGIGEKTGKFAVIK